MPKRVCLIQDVVLVVIKGMTYTCQTIRFLIHLVMLHVVAMQEINDARTYVPYSYGNARCNAGNHRSQNICLVIHYTMYSAPVN